MSETGVYKLGEIEKVSIYCDKYMEPDKVICGRKGVDYSQQIERKSIKNLFLIGHSNVLESYEKVVYRYVNKRINLKNIHEYRINSTP